MVFISSFSLAIAPGHRFRKRTCPPSAAGAQVAYLKGGVENFLVRLPRRGTSALSKRGVENFLDDDQ